MACSSTKLSSRGDSASPCFNPLWISNKNSRISNYDWLKFCAFHYPIGYLILERNSRYKMMPWTSPLINILWVGRLLTLGVPALGKGGSACIDLTMPASRMQKEQAKVSCSVRYLPHSQRGTRGPFPLPPKTLSRSSIAQGNIIYSVKILKKKSFKMLKRWFKECSASHS